ncbi:Fungal lipase-like domain [Sesbania bispinosa]|nr:Fungal lipase-like domain [Sesbania bispinosa]
MHSIFNQLQLQRSRADKVEKDKLKEEQETHQTSFKSEVKKKEDDNYGISKYSSDDEDTSDSKWKIERAWLTKALEPALQFCRWALPTGDRVGNKPPPSNRSLTEIIAYIQRNKIVIQDWSLSDLTIGLYLIYLRQASTHPFEDIKGTEISSESIVQDLIYHLELAKGAYKGNPAILSRNSMLRESNVIKFVKNSSVMRPAYYIGVDPRKKLVILGIRGTHTLYDLITDIVSSSDGEVTFEGYSTHFGTAESARWFLHHEIAIIRKYLEKHEGYRLRLVGHSLGGAIASLLAIMIHRKSSKELGFNPDIVSAVGYGTPPCVSRELAECCSGYVTTVVMQDDIIPRLSVASLTRLRNEILQTDWMSVIERDDWKSIIDLVTNAKQVVYSVQDVARKLGDYTSFGRNKSSTVGPTGKELPVAREASLPPKAAKENSVVMKIEGTKPAISEELLIPGTVYYLKRNLGSQNDVGKDFFTLLKRQPGEHFPRIILSGNLFTDHRCDSHYYALRDVLKGLPWSGEEVHAEVSRTP